MSEPFVVKVKNDLERGLALYVFDETVLAFVEGPERKVFISAYKRQAFDMKYSNVSERKVIEMQGCDYDVSTKYAYLNKITDSKIISIAWQHQNVNGTRNRRLLPENNPLNITLEYGRITWSIGDYSFYATFSNASEAKQVCSLYEKSKTTIND